jgi:hypothetical protein
MEKGVRKAADFVASWNAFVERENGFYPPKIAALYLGMTTQAIYSASDRGFIRNFTIGSERFYSASDCYRYREARRSRQLDSITTPLDRHLAKAGISLPVLLDTVPDGVVKWNDFLRDNGGAYPPRVAALYLRVQVQTVRAASERGWIRRFLVGRENFFSRRDLVNYWQVAARKNRGNRSFPRFLDSRDCGKL